MALERKYGQLCVHRMEEQFSICHINGTCNLSGMRRRAEVPGKIPLLWDPLGFTAKLSPEALARKRNSGLKNGRLAMIGVASLVCGHYYPDSVPLLPAVM